MSNFVDFNSVRNAIRNRSIHSATNAELESAVGVLANTGIPNENVRHEAIVMADAIHSILLRRLLDEQERRNRKTQFWFMVLAMAALVSAVIQIGLGIFSIDWTYNRIQVEW